MLLASPSVASAQEEAGSSCLNPVVISDTSTPMMINDAGEHWFKINLDLLPMGVFYPSEVTGEALKAEVDFHCPGIPYTDPTLEAAVKMIEKDNGVSLPFTVKFEETDRVISGETKHGYELVISNKYKTLLMAYGILYETYAYVKITIPEAVAPDPEEEPQPIEIIPEEELVDCMEGAEYIRVGDKVTVVGADASTIHILPLNTWRADTVLVYWAPDNNQVKTLRMFVGSACSVDTAMANPQLLKRYLVSSNADEPLTLTPNEMAALAAAAGSEDVFVMFYSSLPGQVTTKRPDHTTAVDRDGLTKATAFEFDWINGNVQPAGRFWYHLLLDTLYEYEGPDMAYHIVNLGDEAFTAHLTAEAAGEKESRDISLAIGQDWYRHENAGTLIRMNIHDIYYIVDTDQPVRTYAQVSESGVSDAGCLEAKDFDWENGNDQAANKSLWYAIDMREVMRSEVRKDVKVNIVNMSDVVNPSKVDISLNCPSTGVTPYETNLAARDTLTKTLGSGMLNSIADSVVYVKLTAEQAVHVFAEVVDVETGPLWDDCGDAYRLLVDGQYTYPYTHITMVGGVRDTADIGDTLLYKIKVEDLRGKKMLPEVTVTNLGDRTVTINGEVSFECPAYSVQKQSVSLGAGASNVGQIDKSMVDGVNAEYIYIRMWAEQPFSFSARLKNTNEGTACLTAREFEWNKDLLQNPEEAGTPSTFWYSIDLYEAKQTRSDILVRITNRSNETIPVTADLAFDCPYADLMSQTRTVAAGESMERVIDYSTFAMLGSAQIYAAVTAAQNVTLYGELVPRGHVEPDSACMHAVPYDWANGMRVQTEEPKDTLWVAVDMDSLRNTTLLPKIIVTNHCDKNIEFDGMFIVECPDSVGGRKQSFTLKGDSTYARTMSRDIIRQLDPSIETGYIRIIATGLCIDYSFRVEMIQPDAGVSCAMPITFNWLSGHDQDADKTLWYEIDLTEAKAGKKDISLLIKNKTATACSLELAYAPQCPCEQPQTASLSLAANGQNTRKIPYSMYETMGSRIWIRLSSCTAVHFEASMDDPEPFDAIPCPDDAHKVNLTFNTEYAYPAPGTEPGDTVFYIITGEELDTLRQNEKLSIRSHVAVGDCGAQTVTGMIYYHCPIDAQPMKQTVSLSAGQDSYKLLERSMIDQILTHDSVVVMMVSPKCFTFEAELYDPNSGQDCQHALREDLGCNIQEAGETKWYRYDVSTLSKMDTMLTIEAINLSGTASDIVSVTAYGSCGGEELLSRKTTIAPGDTVRKEIPADMLLGVSSDYAYLKITTSQQTKICLSGREYEPYGPIYVTDEIEVVPNIPLVDQMPDSVWYTLNIGGLVADTCWNEVTIRVRNTDTHAAHLFGELAWSYEITHAMTTRNMTINVGDTLQRTLTRADLESLRDRTPFVRLTSDAKVEILIIADLCEVGESCTDPIAIDWQYGNLHQSDEARWYAVELIADSIEAHASDALIVNFANVATEQTVVYADLYHNCIERDPFEHLQDTLAAGESRTRVLYNCALHELFDGGYLVFCYRSKLTTRISFTWVPAELTDSLYETQVINFEENPTYEWRGQTLAEPGMYFDTIQYNNPLYAQCDSSRYAIYIIGKVMEDTVICGDDSPVWHNMTLDSTGIYYDTIRYVDKTYLGFTLDSAYYEMYVTKYKLDTIGVDTVVVNFAETPTYVWRDSNITMPGVYLDTVRYANTQCDSAQYMLHVIEKVIEADTLCGDDVLAWHGLSLDTTGIYYDTIRYAEPLYPNLLKDSAYYEMHIQKYKLEKDSLLDTLVYEMFLPFEWRGLSLTNDTTCSDTIFYEGTKHCPDSIFTLHLAIERIADIDTTAIICSGDSIVMFDTNVYKETGDYKDTIRSILGRDSIRYELHLTVRELRKDSTLSVIVSSDSLPYIWRNDTLTATDTYVQNIYYPDSICIDSIFTLNLTVKNVTIIEKYDTICHGDTLYWETYQMHKLTEQGTYGDTLKYTGMTIDSIRYAMHLTVHDSIVAPVETVVLCNGDSLNWHGEWYKTTGTYNYQSKYPAPHSCDSVLYTLDLTIREVKDSLYTDSICNAESYTWRNKSWPLVSNNLPVEVFTLCDTVRYAADNACDSIRYQMKLTVFRPIYTETEHVTVCADQLQTYTWEVNGKQIGGFKGDSVATDVVKKLTYPFCDSIISTLSLVVNKPLETIRDTAATICYNEEFIWHGKKCDTTGIYFDTLRFVSGCDSVYRRLYLTVRNLPDTVWESSPLRVCDGSAIQWRNKWISESGVHVDTLKYPGTDCDSLYYMVNLIVLQPQYGDTTYTRICPNDTYSWRGKNYTSAGWFSDTLRYDTPSKCDSIIYTLYIEVVESQIMPVEKQSICHNATFTWFNEEYSKPGTYTHAIPSVLGCDSLVYTLELSMQEATKRQSDTLYICGSGSVEWDLNHKQYTADGLYYETIQGITGCDSIAGELRVIVKQAEDKPMETYTIYDDETYTWHGMTLDEAGVYEYRETYAVSGCDSAIYHITIVHEPITVIVNPTIMDTVCPGTNYDADHTITTHTTWAVSEREGGQGSGQPLVEYVTNYDINVYTTYVPEDLLVGTVGVHCGSPVMIGQAMTELTVAMNDPLFAPNPVVTWEYLQNSGIWMPLDTTVALDGATTTVGVRCTVTTDCQPPVVVEGWFDVDTVASYESIMYDLLPVIPLYGGTLYMVDRDDVIKRYKSIWNSVPDSTDVWWYRQVGSKDDWNDPDGERNDVALGWGWYFVPQQQDQSLAPGSSATYYALIKHVEIKESGKPCSTVARTVEMDYNTQYKLTPNIAETGTDVVITPSGAYMIEVHRASGTLVWSGGPATMFSTKGFGTGTFVVTATNQATGDVHHFTLMLY